MNTLVILAFLILSVFSSVVIAQSVRRMFHVELNRPLRHKAMKRHWRAFFVLPRGIVRFFAWIPGNRLRPNVQFCNTFERVEFANENAKGSILLCEISNELKVGDDGWAQIAPMGDHPGMALVDDGKGKFKKVKAIQRINKESCTTMANEFANASNGAKKYFASRPIFMGHPDVPGYELKYPDKSPKGVFSELQVRADGLFGKPIFTPEGSELVEGKNGKKLALSGRWNAESLGDENGVPVYTPSVFLSAGLTDKPNLPVQLLNEAEPGEESPADRATRLMGAAYDAGAAAKKSSAMAKMSNTADAHIDAFHKNALASDAHSQAKTAFAQCKNDGMAADNDGDADDYRHAAVGHFKAAKQAGKAASASVANEKEIETMAEDAKYTPKETVKSLSEKLATKTTEVATVANERDFTRGELVTEKQALVDVKKTLETVTIERDSLKMERDGQLAKFSNERNARIGDEIDSGIVDGRITPSDRPDWERRLKVEGQFANEVKALRNIVATKIKTRTITMERGGRKIELANSQDRAAMFKEVMASTAAELKLDLKKDYDKVFKKVCIACPELVGTSNHPIVRRN